MASKRPSSSVDQANNKKKAKAYCHFKASWKKQDFSITINGEEGEPKRTVVVSGSILSAEEGADSAKCKVCGVTFSVRHGSSNDVVKHFSSKHHLEAMTATSSNRSLQEFGFGNTEAARFARKKKEDERMQVRSSTTS